MQCQVDSSCALPQFCVVMKKNDNANGANVICKTAACMECDLCKAINFEEKRVAKLESNNEMRSLYGAEALSYYFYFMPASNRA